MDVVKSNFKDQMEQFFSKINETEFVSIDLEFTGIRTEEKTSRTDTCRERYQKCYQVPKNYQIIQFGISQFIKKSEKEYDCFTYNFYTFPSSFNEKFDTFFKCDVGTMEFLVNCGSIDFNKWINQGIPYFNKSQIDKIKKNLLHDTIQDIYDNGVKYATFFNTKEQQEQAISDWQQIKEWIEDQQSAQTYIYKQEFFPFKKYIIEKFLKEFKSIKNNFFFQEQYYADIKKRYLKISKVTPQLNIQLKEEKKALRLAELEEKKGFTSFWDKLTYNIQKNKIPVVGHNMYLDLLYVYNHFEEFLTDDYQQYKEGLKRTFPIIYDTKIFQCALKMKQGQGLEQIYQELIQKNQIKINDKNFSLSNGVAHNAGFDAFMTGACYLMFQKELDIYKFKNCIKLYGHPYIAMKNENQDDFLIHPEIYVVGFKGQNQDKNQKIKLQKIFAENQINTNIQLEVVEKRLKENNQKAFYLLYFEELDSIGNFSQEVNKILKIIKKEFKDVIDYNTYDLLTTDLLKSNK